MHKLTRKNIKIGEQPDLSICVLESAGKDASIKSDILFVTAEARANLQLQASQINY